MIDFFLFLLHSPFFLLLLFSFILGQKTKQNRKLLFHMGGERREGSPKKKGEKKMKKKKRKRKREASTNQFSQLSSEISMYICVFIVFSFFSSGFSPN